MAVTFTPPDDNTAPTQGDSGASRGSFRFIPPSNSATFLGAVGDRSRLGFIPPPNNATPYQTASGASRDGELDDNVLLLFSGEGEAADMPPANAVPMMAVTPPNLYGLTISARPTIMAYLPQTKAHTAIFSLKDERQAVVYSETVSLDGADGILAISLPDDAPELSVGEYYQWFVTLQTEDYITPGSPYVDAWIKRVDVATIMAHLPEQDGLAKAEVLARNGIWYDAAEQLANLQLEPQTQNDTLGSWAEFLTSVGLDELSDRSFLQLFYIY
ncbi:MAG: DUF928 domain-containing protein [Cyanobacteria bacterium P01_F01_bin.116]